MGAAGPGAGAGHVPPSCVHGAGVHLWPARLRRAWPRVCGRCPTVCHPRGPAFPFHTSSPLRWHRQRVAAAPQRPVRGRCCLTGTAGPAGGNTCPVDSGLRGPHADTVLSVIGAPCLGRSQASHWPALSSPGRLRPHGPLPPPAPLPQGGAPSPETRCIVAPVPGRGAGPRAPGGAACLSAGGERGCLDSDPSPPVGRVCLSSGRVSPWQIHRGARTEQGGQASRQGG